MNAFSWVKIVMIMVALSVVHLVAPPVETIAGNRAAMGQMQPSDEAYVNWSAWAATPDKSGAIYGIVALLGVVIMIPEIKRGINKFKQFADEENPFVQ